MTAREQLDLDGYVVEAVVPEQRHAPGAQQEQPERERDRWRVSGLFVQPREHNELEDPERER